LNSAERGERDDDHQRDEDDRDEQVRIHATASVAYGKRDRDRASAPFRIGRYTGFGPCGDPWTDQLLGHERAAEIESTFSDLRLGEVPLRDTGAWAEQMDHLDSPSGE
jgi:hypothetical protein